MKQAFFAVLVPVGLAMAVTALAEQTVAEQQDSYINFRIHGDHINYSPDIAQVVFEGNVTLVIEAPGGLSEHAVIKADRVQADLQKATVNIENGAAVAIGPGVLAGQTLQLNVRSQEFALQQPRGYLALPPPDRFPEAPGPRIYFNSSKVAKTGDVTTIYDGRVTTCPRKAPDYCVRADRITYNTSTGDLRVHGAELEIHGIKIPLLPWLRTKVGGRNGAYRPYSFGLPGYSSREGLYVPFSLALDSKRGSWDSTNRFKLTTHRGITGSMLFHRQWGHWDLDVTMSRKTWMGDDIEDTLAISRYPQLTLTRPLSDPHNCDRQLDLKLDLGNFTEELEDQDPTGDIRPSVDERRVLLQLDYMANPRQFKTRRGWWYGASGRISAYSTDETYRDMSLFAGAGEALSDSFVIDATLKHHFTGGTTPFLFDDVDIKTELQASAIWRLSDRWRLTGSNRYDLDIGDMRDYKLGLSYRAGCLTWGLYYRNVGNHLGVRVDLTGLTGDTRPLRERSALEKQMGKMGLAPQITAHSKGCKRPIKQHSEQGRHTSTAKNQFTEPNQNSKGD